MKHIHSTQFLVSIRKSLCVILRAFINISKKGKLILFAIYEVLVDAVAFIQCMYTEELRYVEFLYIYLYL